MNQFPSLFKGQLLRLAAYSKEDAPTFARWTESDEYMRLMDTDIIRPYSSDQINELAEKYWSGANQFHFTLRTLTDDQLIGFVSLHDIEWNNGAALLAIGIGESANWGKGYGTEAMQLILRYAFEELNLYRVGLDVISYNTRAIRAYEKAGFLHEGAFRAAINRDGQRYDRIFMGILRDEWRRLAEPGLT